MVRGLCYFYIILGVPNPVLFGKNLGKSEFDEMPLNAVKTHQGRLLRIALGKCIYLKIRIVNY